MPRHVAVVLLLVFPLAGLASSAVPPPATVEANLAWLRSSGSSDRETLKLRLAGTLTRGEWTHEALLEGLRERGDGGTTPLSQRGLWREKSSWNFTERDYLFGKAQGERDVQSTYRRQVLLALGYGRRLIADETMDLAADLGAGVRRSKDRATRISDDEAIANGALNFTWRIREGTRFAAELSVDSGKLSTTTRTRSALSIALGEGLHAEVAHETKNENGPTRQRDSITTVGLAYRR